VSSRERWLREFAEEVRSSRRVSPEALNEVMDYIDDVYGDALAALGGRVLALYSIALLHTVKRNPRLLRKITKELACILEELSSSEGRASPEVRDRIRKLLKELEEIAKEAIGG